ncbi:sensor histidine kinase [Streptomyces sp. BA2]|uniref:sensor histidine kinase n=1 Tax=Streptomyces sp. BA2 TaxID=436595 RepID=UPI00132938AC|nr:ATP-binding protein [Streptomyces sp. BA2]MWA10040.1 ATP-binding protein [Streptomyces sp. BA2]
MELATPPSAAARAPAAWYSWWLLPAGLGAGSVATLAAGSDPARIPAAVAALAAAAAAAACVRLLLRTRQELRRAADDARTAQLNHSQQWQQHVAVIERRHEDERAAYEAHQMDEAKAWQWRLDRQQALVARLADEFLPAAFEGLRGGEAIEDVLPRALDQETEISPEFRLELRKVLRTGLIAVEEEFNRSTSAEQAVISIGSRIHVLTGKIRGRLHEMQGEHGGTPAVAQGLMELDQAIGPADCLAASIGVLGGTDRPGRQWQEPQRLLSVVRGGIGRIKDFDRVQLRQLPELGVDGGLVDHLTLIFAHLLDNAARYSPPTEPVVVSGKEVPNGVGIEIQDAGKGLTDEKKQQALQALDGVADGPGIGGLSEDAHLGLRVVGTLARKHGIRVAFADSPWLGTSVVVVVPHKYFSRLPPAPVTTPAQARRQAPAVETAPRSRPAVASAAQQVRAAEDVTPGGLPRRRSKRTDSPGRAGARPETTKDTPAPPAAPPDASFTGMAAFATAGRETEEPRTEESD